MAEVFYESLIRALTNNRWVALSMGGNGQVRTIHVALTIVVVVHNILFTPTTHTKQPFKNCLLRSHIGITLN